MLPDLDGFEVCRRVQAHGVGCADLVLDGPRRGRRQVGTAYTVQLAFTGNPTKLRDGIQAAVTITTAQAADTLAVPTSAVNHLGTRDYVLVLNGRTTNL